MDLGGLSLEEVYRNNRSYEQRTRPKERTLTPLQVRLDNDRSPSFSSSDASEPDTVVPWHSPPAACPTPPSRSIDTVRAPDHYRRSIGSNDAAHSSSTPLVVRFDEEQIRNTEAEAAKREGKMATTDTDSSPPTPTDDTPYIRFAIDQLTRDQDVKAATRGSTPTTTSTESYPVERIVPDYGLGYVTAESRDRDQLALIRKHRSSPGEGRLFAFNATRPLSPRSAEQSPRRNSARQKRVSIHDAEIYIPVAPPAESKYRNLTFKPTILRPLSMITLACLCILMIAALIFSAVFSSRQHGLAQWYDGIYGGRYFVFSFLPQILAATILVYSQCVLNAITRIMPYALMASDDADERTNALFVGAFPKSMLYPRLEGPIMIDIARLFFWLSVFTIPLQSCLFSVIIVDGNWKWTAVQGVAWTLVGVYTLILVATVLTGVYFFRRTTGLMWDPRSLADIISMLPKSNALADYPGTDIMTTNEEIRQKLDTRSDRLGYWRTRNHAQEMFYCIGEEGPATQQFPLPAGKQERSAQVDSGDVEQGGEHYNAATRFRYLPWYLRDTFVIFWSVAAFIFLLALFIISFLPTTEIQNGFPPLVSALPDSAGFSAANFLYSFIPSVIGMLLFLSFQPLDYALRQLQPWAELANIEGSPAEQSLLLDYPFLLPVSCTIKAARLGHYKIAFTSLLSTLFVLIPVLAGGVFFPLTVPSMEVRMIPNLPSYYIILALLILYFAGLLVFIPGRKNMGLPHATDCLAENISFLYKSWYTAFQGCKSKDDLRVRLNARKIGGGVNKFRLGVFGESANEGGVRLGVDRVGVGRRWSNTRGALVV